MSSRVTVRTLAVNLAVFVGRTVIDSVGKPAPDGRWNSWSLWNHWNLSVASV